MKIPYDRSRPCSKPGWMSTFQAAQTRSKITQKSSKTAFRPKIFFACGALRKGLRLCDGAGEPKIGYPNRHHHPRQSGSGSENPGNRTIPNREGRVWADPAQYPGKLSRKTEAIAHKRKISSFPMTHSPIYAVATAQSGALHVGSASLRIAWRRFRGRSSARERISGTNRGRSQKQLRSKPIRRAGSTH